MYSKIMCSYNNNKFGGTIVWNSLQKWKKKKKISIEQMKC